MPKELTKKEQEKFSLLKLLKQKTAELKENIKKQKQKNAPFKILLVVVGKKEGPAVSKFLNEKKIDVQLLFFSKDYSQSPVQNVFALNYVEQDTIIALTDSKKADNILNELYTNFDFHSESKGKFACIMPPSSATLETIKILVKNYKKPIQL